MSYPKLKTLAVYLFSLLSIGAIARDPVIYGEDNRIETLESKNMLYKRLASATAALIPNQNLSIEGRNAFVIAPTIADHPKVNVCPEERFAHQPKAADCSGVLVAPDIIATAGHCYIMNQSNCATKAWVFNFNARNARQSRFAVRTRDVYRCKEVITEKLTEIKPQPDEIYIDHALIRLDRPVVNVTPVKVSATMPRVGTKVLTIGNPSGLPQKIADGGVVKSVNRYEFRATVDTFNFGSGSPVFDQETGEYLGVLSRGGVDYVKHPQKDCDIPNILSEELPGEYISSTIQFIKLLESL